MRRSSLHPGLLVLVLVVLGVATRAEAVGDAPPPHAEEALDAGETEAPEPPPDSTRTRDPLRAWKPFLRPPGLPGQTPWVAPESLLVDWVGHGRARQLREARFHFFLSDDHPSHVGGAEWRDPEPLADYEDVVLSAWGKVVRDALEDALGIEQWWDRKVRHVGTPRRDRETSWRLRVSPRLAEDRLGIKFRLPYTRVGLLDHLSMRVRYDWEEDRTSWILKLDDGARFVHLGYEPDTREGGDLLSLSIRLAW